MSKIGRRPIALGSVKVEISGQEVRYSGSRGKGVYVLPALLKAVVEENSLTLSPIRADAEANRVWGLHRALLSNKITGVDKGFQKKVTIVGLGFKAQKKGSGIEFSLGYSHKIDFPLPAQVAVEIDKTGQALTFDSIDKELLGGVCSQVCALRPVEPYKGTGIHYTGSTIRRKAGKAKA